MISRLPCRRSSSASSASCSEKDERTGHGCTPDRCTGVRERAAGGSGGGLGRWGAERIEKCKAHVSPTLLRPDKCYYFGYLDLDPQALVPMELAVVKQLLVPMELAVVGIGTCSNDTM